MRLLLLVSIILSIASCSTAPLKGDKAGKPLKSRTISGCLPKTLDQQPQLISGKAPIYPISMLLNRKSGSATIHYDILPDGSIANVKAHSEDYKYFASHAAHAMKTWAVKPGAINGVPTTAYCKFVMNFKIK